MDHTIFDKHGMHCVLNDNHGQYNDPHYYNDHKEEIIIKEELADIETELKKKILLMKKRKHY